MKQDYRQLLQPKIINSLSGLSLIASVVVEGYLSGLHQSRRVGAGLEFSQYRAYEPGDDLRLLDWKMLARSGRYYVKQSEIDTHITVKFILDASKSMLHQENGIAKLDYAKVLIASLASLAQNQGDKIGLFALNDQSLKTVAPVLHKQQYTRFLHQLISVEGKGKWPEKTLEFDKLHDRSRKELLFFITDMHEDATELSSKIKGLKTKRNEVVVLQIMGKNELQFNYDGYVIFEDLETGTKVKVDAKSAKSNYLRAFRETMGVTKDMLLSNGIAHHLFSLDQPIGEALKLFLKQRTYLM
ncbi:MAG: DUF58 domain-containing protein [Maribacter sp.]|uniref:DUF58 domain-containing protein n=1 Tax=Maribacter sp. TaxID=1897614 RepID=UPI0032985E48